MGPTKTIISPIKTSKSPVETSRLLLQSLLEAGKTTLERRKLGQFATPTRLALEISEFAIKHLDISNKIRFFDTAFGTGLFIPPS
jgi:hypothetical protein